MAKDNWIEVGHEMDIAYYCPTCGEMFDEGDYIYPPDSKTGEGYFHLRNTHVGGGHYGQVICGPVHRAMISLRYQEDQMADVPEAEAQNWLSSGR